jgi:hypothetical protein
MNRHAIRLTACFASVCLFSAHVHGQDQEEVRFALVVGNNKGDAPERSLQYAEEEVSRLASVLQSQGGFAHVQLVQGRDRSTLESELRNMRTRIESVRSAGQRTLFMFYYSGHGTKDGLELGVRRRLPIGRVDRRQGWPSRARL